MDEAILHGASDALEQLLAQALELLEEGGTVALERFLAEHPREQSVLGAEVGRLRRMGLLFDERSPQGPPERVGDFRLWGAWAAAGWASSTRPSRSRSGGASRSS